MSNELKKEQEELQKKAEDSAKTALKSVGFDYAEHMMLYKATVDYLKCEKNNLNSCIALLIDAIIGAGIKRYLTEKPNPKKLPNIAIIGDFWELAPIETLLIWEGYDLETTVVNHDVEWNDDIFNDCFREHFPVPIEMIVANGDAKTVHYHNHALIPHKTVPFTASEPEKILQYIHDFNK